MERETADSPKWANRLAIFLTVVTLILSGAQVWARPSCDSLLTKLDVRPAPSFDQQTSVLLNLEALLRSGSSKDDVTRIFESVLELEKSGSGSNATFTFLSKNFKYLKDDRVKSEIVEYFMGDLALGEEDGQREGLFFFAKLNPRPEFDCLPVALGPDRVLKKLRSRTHSVDYTEWESLGWMDDSKDIGKFRSTFRQALTQTSAANFEIGPLIKDLPSLKKAFADIRRNGDLATLRKLAQFYRGLDEDADTPRLNKGAASITNLELYWIVTNPKFLAKTTFYKQYKPMSEAEVNKLVNILRRR